MLIYFIIKLTGQGLILFTLLAQSIFSAPSDDKDSTSGLALADPAAKAWYGTFGYYGQGYGYGGYYGSTTKSPWSGLYGGNGMNYGRKKREADPAVLATTAVELTALDAITPTVMPTIIPSTVKGGKSQKRL